MDYAMYDPAPEAMTARVTFENPADADRPIIVDVAIEAGTGELFVDSPWIPCIDNGKRYTVVLELMRTDGMTERLTQEVLFHIPGGDFRKIGLSQCAA